MYVVVSPTSLLGALKTRNISPVTICRGDLELGQKKKIKVMEMKEVMVVLKIVMMVLVMAMAMEVMVGD